MKPIRAIVNNKCVQLNTRELEKAIREGASIQFRSIPPESVSEVAEIHGQGALGLLADSSRIFDKAKSEGKVFDEDADWVKESRKAQRRALHCSLLYNMLSAVVNGAMRQKSTHAPFAK